MAIATAWLLAVIALIPAKSDFTYALSKAHDFLIAPVTSMAVNDSAKIISPALLLLVVIGLFIQENTPRKLLLQVVSIIWVFFGFLYVAGVN